MSEKLILKELSRYAIGTCGYHLSKRPSLQNREAFVYGKERITFLVQFE
jgi:hypothetical protein